MEGAVSTAMVEMVEGGHRTDDCSQKAPDIRYSSLTEEISEEEIKIAITKGEYEGETLDWCMSRWQMSDEDLNDVIAYFKELG